MISKHKVELIVIGANKLEARLIKKVLTDIASKIKDFGERMEFDEERKGSKKRPEDDNEG
jgi:hypothetical protein